MVSIIVTHKKGLAYLEDCLESISEQEFQDYETILVVDGNEDDPSCPFGYRHYSYGRNRYQHVSVQGSHGYCGQEDATR